jgi:hypothetical protein
MVLPRLAAHGSRADGGRRKAADEDALVAPTIGEAFPRKRFVKRCTSRFRGNARSYGSLNSRPGSGT